MEHDDFDSPLRQLRKADGMIHHAGEIEARRGRSSWLGAPNPGPLHPDAPPLSAGASVSLEVGPPEAWGPRSLLPLGPDVPWPLRRGGSAGNPGRRRAGSRAERRGTDAARVEVTYCVRAGPPLSPQSPAPPEIVADPAPAPARPPAPPAAGAETPRAGARPECPRVPSRARPAEASGGGTAWHQPGRGAGAGRASPRLGGAGTAPWADGDPPGAGIVRPRLLIGRWKGLGTSVPRHRASTRPGSRALSPRGPGDRPTLTPWAARGLPPLGRAPRLREFLPSGKSVVIEEFPSWAPASLLLLARASAPSNLLFASALGLSPPTCGFLLPVPAGQRSLRPQSSLLEVEGTHAQEVAREGLRETCVQRAVTLLLDCPSPQPPPARGFMDA
ncbi:translation initiation factor IF-2-like [Felis catus]|uniref:translation initiation factor IF-2-like n=1 Tax=Felis catus TaxID=9685 RepID=UPI001D19ABB7|nr:translation initiation factor IF-2-like [Felis catus]